ncbi:MAG: 16S rRNA (guanine(966)-N(2))-methyltransferase RsmD [Gammaproteobacteria bacterium HGW-Gammaproteobacteria-3]|nr:MAG: 16S rRNA (guanine(966)-N(2))-methyltransferase RsmD [Gammaproteobacteria bacterium HGW-Gammaproteobacteria-3]
MQNKLRIIGGNWRSRQLQFPDLPGLRPTPARARETLFNWLQNEVSGSRCLDLYAGSGALGFEAASRGAKNVVQVETDALACRYLKDSAEMLSAHQIKIVRQDVFRFLASDPEPFDLVFLDPPFSRNQALQTCQWLEEKGWLAPGARIYVEVESGLKLEAIPANWILLKSKKAGEVGYHLFARKSA